MRNLSVLALLSLLTVLVSSVTILPKNVAATYVTKLKVEPVGSIFYTNTTSVGHTFTVSIIAENIIIESGGMYGWELILSWDAGKIDCISEDVNVKMANATNSTGWWAGGNSGPLVGYPIDNAAGTYHQALAARAPSKPVTGTFWLANVTFQIMSAPPEGGTLSTDLTLQPYMGYVYCLIDKFAGEIPHEFINGLYKFISPRPPLPEMTLKITPPTIINPSLVPSKTFDINVTIINTAYIHKFSLKLSYNSTIIECITVQEGDLLQKFGATTMTYQINNPEEYTFVSTNLTDSGAVASGNGTLATFTFHVLNMGDSLLHLYETQLYDVEGLSLPHATSDGYFNNILLPKLFVDPPLIVDPSMKPPTEFEIDVNVANVSDLYDFEFKLEYDTNVLNGLGILVHPFGNETSFDTQLKLNDTAGEIWVRVQYYPSAEPLTSIPPVTVVTVFFQVQSYGATWLHLDETCLSDSLGMPITHITQDGYVSVLRRDIAIVNVTPQYTEVYKGWIFNIAVTAENIGDIPETFNVTVFCNDHSIGIQQVTDLAPNDTISLIFTFDTVQPWIEPCHNHTMKAEASQVPYEIDVTNNVLTDGQIHVKMMGDIDGNGYVNVADAVILGNAFGSKPGDPNWDPRCDMNQDSYINIKDTILLGMNFGASCL